MSRFFASRPLDAPMVTLHLWHPSLQPPTSPPSPISPVSSLTNVPLSSLIAPCSARSAGLGAAPRLTSRYSIGFDVITSLFLGFVNYHKLPPHIQCHLQALLDHLGSLSTLKIPPGFECSSGVSLCPIYNPTCPLDPSGIPSLIYSQSPCFDYVLHFHGRAADLFDTVAATLLSPPPSSPTSLPLDSHSCAISSVIVSRSTNDGSDVDVPLGGDAYDERGRVAPVRFAVASSTDTKPSFLTSIVKLAGRAPVDYRAYVGLYPLTSADAIDCSSLLMPPSPTIDTAAVADDCGCVTAILSQLAAGVKSSTALAEKSTADVTVVPTDNRGGAASLLSQSRVDATVAPANTVLPQPTAACVESSKAHDDVACVDDRGGAATLLPQSRVDATVARAETVLPQSTAAACVEFNTSSIISFLATNLLGADTTSTELLLSLHWLRSSTFRFKSSSFPNFGLNIYFKFIEPEPPPSSNPLH